MYVWGVSRVSYYQDVSDPNIPVEDVKARLDNVCEILDTNPPETIVYEESWGSFQRPRLLDNGRTIILYKSQEDSILNWQICNLYHPLVSKRSPRWIVRHYDYFMLLPTMFMMTNVFLLLFLRSGLVDINLAYVLLLLQFLYAGVSLYWKKGSEDNMMQWISTMKQAGVWPDNLGSNFEKTFRKLPIAIVIGFILFALIFGSYIVLR